MAKNLHRDGQMLRVQSTRTNEEKAMSFIPGAAAIRTNETTPGTFDVTGELHVVLKSAAFRRAPRLRRLLDFAVHRVLDSGVVTERDAARGVFGKGEDFDPCTDPTVRVHYGRLRRRLDDYFNVEGREDAVQIRIPMREYTPVFAFKADLNPAAA